MLTDSLDSPIDLIEPNFKALFQVLPQCASRDAQCSNAPTLPHIQLVANGITPTSRIRGSIMLPLLTPGNCDLRLWVGLKWHEIHISFRKIRSTYSEVTRLGPTLPTQQCGTERKILPFFCSDYDLKSRYSAHSNKSYSCILKKIGYIFTITCGRYQQ